MVASLRLIAWLVMRFGAWLQQPKFRQSKVTRISLFSCANHVVWRLPARNVLNAHPQRQWQGQATELCGIPGGNAVGRQQAGCLDPDPAELTYCKMEVQGGRNFGRGRPIA